MKRKCVGMRSYRRETKDPLAVSKCMEDRRGLLRTDADLVSERDWQQDDVGSVSGLVVHATTGRSVRSADGVDSDGEVPRLATGTAFGPEDSAFRVRAAGFAVESDFAEALAKFEDAEVGADICRTGCSGGLDEEEVGWDDAIPDGDNGSEDFERVEDHGALLQPDADLVSSRKKRGGPQDDVGSFVSGVVVDAATGQSVHSADGADSELRVVVPWIAVGRFFWI